MVYTHKAWAEAKREFPKIRDTPFGEVPIIRTIVYWGLYLGPLILGNYQRWWASDFLGFRVYGLGFRDYRD